ncbi:MAG TPA: mechanosensitive ion channel family protein [Pyrinomonadaceae bacterium]|jgi:small-conductance mechanosensitive channel|nr:mechanosensitive ion channel family protein [Pyrinomonadaceae bacterium]
MADDQAKVEALKEDVDVKRELEQARGTREKKKGPRRRKLWLVIYLIPILVFSGVYYIFRSGYFKFAAQYESLVGRLIVAAIAISAVLLVLYIVKAYLIDSLSDPVARYNLKHVANLLAGLGIFFIAITALFANWYTAVVSLGVISVILGFALQAPITSFIGWIYILTKVPYRVGDRIQINMDTGDVISVNYLDTTLWEVGGRHLSTDHPSGRIIKFPNSSVLTTPVHNYSWSLFPYIWNDIKFQVAYQSDLDFVEKVLRETAEEEVGPIMKERIGMYRELLAETPVDQLEVNERPVVVFRTDQTTWVNAIVRYLVEPRQAGPVKTRLIRKMLVRLNSEPEKVLLPKGDAR